MKRKIAEVGWGNIQEVVGEMAPALLFGLSA